MEIDHSQVFTDADIKRAFEIMKEGEQEGWIGTGVRKDWAQTWKKYDYDSRIPFYIKSTLHADGVPLEECKELMANGDLRNKWDSSFHVEQLDSNEYYATTYWIFNLPAPATPRDAVRLVTRPNWIPEENAYLILYKKAHHADKPETSDYIRMDTDLGYWILKQADDDPNVNSTVLFVMGNNNYRGWLPYCLLGYAGSLRMSCFCDDLKQAYKDVYGKDKHQMNSFLDIGSKRVH